MFKLHTLQGLSSSNNIICVGKESFILYAVYSYITIYHDNTSTQHSQKSQLLGLCVRFYLALYLKRTFGGDLTGSRIWHLFAVSCKHIMYQCLRPKDKKDTVEEMSVCQILKKHLMRLHEQDQYIQAQELQCYSFSLLYQLVQHRIALINSEKS